VQTLVDVALGGLFPEVCNEWTSLTQYLRDVFSREWSNKKSAIVRDLANTEASLQRALREEVLNYVIGFFPYVVINLCLAHLQVHLR